MSSGRDSHQEQFARAVVAQVTGATVRRTDVSTAPPRTVDAEIAYHDGRRGALEITTLGLESEFELSARIAGLGGQLPMPGNWKWIIRISEVEELERIKSTYAMAILACEKHRVSTPRDLPEIVLERDVDLRWLAFDSTSDLFGIVIPEGARDISGYVDLTYDRVVASWRDGDSQVPHGVNEALGTTTMRRRVAKLLDTPADERHLFMQVAASGLPEAAYVSLMVHAASPEDATLIEGELAVPEGITHVWLLTGWGQRVTRWTRGVGWDHPSFK